MCRRVPIDIYEGKDKVRKDVNRNILNEGEQKVSIRLYDSVIM